MQHLVIAKIYNANIEKANVTHLRDLTLFCVTCRGQIFKISELAEYFVFQLPGSQEKFIFSKEK